MRCDRRYYAISTSRLSELMREAGLQNVRRLDGVFFSLCSLGQKPPQSDRSVPEHSKLEALVSC